MIDRIQKDDGVQTGVLMDEVSKISEIDSLKKIDLSPYGKKQWNLKYKNALKNASVIIKNYSDVEDFKNGLECGIFVAPYMAGKESIGNKNIVSVLNTKSFSNDELKILKEMVDKESK